MNDNPTPGYIYDEKYDYLHDLPMEEMFNRLKYWAVEVKWEKPKEVEIKGRKVMTRGLWKVTYGWMEKCGETIKDCLWYFVAIIEWNKDKENP